MQSDDPIKPHHRFLKGITYISCSSLTISVSMLFVKLALPLTQFYELTFYRFFLPFSLILPLLFFRHVRRAILSTKNIKTHVLRAFFLSLSFYALFYYITFNSLLEGSIMMNTGPLIVPVLSWIFLKQKMRLHIILGTAIAFIGVLLILKPGAEKFDLTWFIGLLSGIFNAASQVVFGYHAHEEKPSTSLFYIYFFCSILTLVPLLFFQAFGFPVKLSEFEGSLLFVYVAVISIMSIFSQIFQGLAFRQGKPDMLAAFFYLSIVFSGIWEWIFLSRKPDVFSALGAFLVIFGGSFKAAGILAHFKKTQPPHHNT